jgi:hypothetical protein
MFGRPKSKNQALVKQYEQSRRIGEQFSHKIPETYGMNDYLPKILRVFGISKGKKITLESDEELNFLMDFYLHEVQSDGQTLLERYRADNPDLGSSEVMYLDAANASYTSLFKVTEVNPTESTVTVVDLLNPSSPPLEVININLSKTGDVGYIIFSRLLPYEDFNAFSGMYAVFAEQNDRSLLKRYKVMKKRVKSDRESVQRFIACFKLNRILGIAVQTR